MENRIIFIFCIPLLTLLSACKSASENEKEKRPEPVENYSAKWPLPEGDIGCKVVVNTKLKLSGS